MKHQTTIKKPYQGPHYRSHKVVRRPVCGPKPVQPTHSFSSIDGPCVRLTVSTHGYTSLSRFLSIQSKFVLKCVATQTSSKSSTLTKKNSTAHWCDKTPLNLQRGNLEGSDYTIKFYQECTFVRPKNFKAPEHKVCTDDSNQK